MFLSLRKKKQKKWAKSYVIDIGGIKKESDFLT